MINNRFAEIKRIQNGDDSYGISKLFYDENNNLCRGLQYFYYSKMKKRIKNYQNIWGFIIQNKTKLASSHELEQHYVSLSEQYAYLLFNSDQIVKLEKKPRPDNDDVFLMAYFTYNFILSAKSILDVFAWVIREVFLASVSIKPIEVSIIFRDYNREVEKHAKFKKACKESLDVKLYEHLCSDDTQKVFSILEKHRDIVSHKGKIHIMIYDNKDTGEVDIVKPKNPECFRSVKWEEQYKKPNGKYEFETCSKFVDTVVPILDRLFVQINESVLNYLYRMK